MRSGSLKSLSNTNTRRPSCRHPKQRLVRQSSTKKQRFSTIKSNQENTNPTTPVEDQGKTQGSERKADTHLHAIRSVSFGSVNCGLKEGIAPGTAGMTAKSIQSVKLSNASTKQIAAIAKSECMDGESVPSRAYALTPTPQRQRPQ